MTVFLFKELTATFKCLTSIFSFLKKKCVVDDNKKSIKFLGCFEIIDLKFLKMFIISECNEIFIFFYFCYK